MNEKIAFHFRITGTVQGVGFRWAAQEEAQGRGLAGWVCNEDDGSVTGLVQGDEGAVAAFRKWLGRGPRSARVDAIEWTEAATTGLRIFTVR